MTCFCCGEKGHYSDSCPKKDEIDKKDWKIKKGTHMYCNKTEKEKNKLEDKEKSEEQYSGG